MARGIDNQGVVPEGLIIARYLYTAPGPHVGIQVVLKGSIYLYGDYLGLQGEGLFMYYSGTWTLWV